MRRRDGDTVRIPARRLRLSARTGLRAAAALGVSAAAALVLCAPAAARAASQPDSERAFSADAESLPIDVTVRVVDGTTRQPGHAESVTLQESGQRGQVVATESDVTGEAVFRGLFLDETRTYLIQATASGIPYFAKATGHDLAGGPATVYVFATTTDRSAVAVADLSLTVKRLETRLDLEYAIAIVNETSPQQTVLPDPVTLELMLPQDAVSVTFEALSGAGPAKVTPLPGSKPGRAGLAIPLRSGTTRLRATASVPYTGRARLQLEASAPVRKLTMLVYPPDLVVDGDFRDEGIAEDGGFHRWAGSPLAANALLTWQVSGGTGPSIAARQRDRLVDLGRKAQDTVRRARSDRTAFVVSIIALAGIVVLLLARRRLRSADRDADSPDDKDAP